MANIAKERERIRVADLIDKVRAENREKAEFKEFV